MFASVPVFLEKNSCQSPHMQQCRNELCISVNFFCDGKNDCGDWSDEFKCNSVSVFFIIKFKTAISFYFYLKYSLPKKGPLLAHLIVHFGVMTNAYPLVGSVMESLIVISERMKRIAPMDILKG